MSSERSDVLTVARVEELERRRIDALLAADGEALAALQHEGGVVVHSSGFVDAMPSYAANLSSRFFAYRSLRVSERRSSIVGDVAVTVYRQDADMIVAGEPQTTAVRCCAVWSIERGTIGLALVQSTRLAP